MAFLLVDESGEEGFSETSSEWFILGGALQRGRDAQKARAMYNEFREETRRDANWYFHFHKQEHDARLKFIEKVSASPYEGIGILFHKRSISKHDNFRKKYFLYFYALRFLIEKASTWAKYVANEPLFLILSSRGGLEKENVEEYLQTVKSSSFVLDNMLWDYFCHDDIKIAENKDYIGLQVADCVAGAICRAVEPHKTFKTLEDRYIKDLSPIFGKQRWSISSRIKLWPTPAADIRAQKRLDWYYGRGG